MDIYILNENFEIISIIDRYESVIWTTRFFSIGDFEIYMPATKTLVEDVRNGVYLVRDKDVSIYGKLYNVMVIEKIQLLTDIEDGDHMIVSGRCLKSILSRRIIWTQTTLNGYVHTAINTVVSDNIVNPSIAERKISNFEVRSGSPSSASGYKRISRQVTGDNLAEFVEEVCKTYGYGWRVFVESKTICFQLVYGTNRSRNQVGNPLVEFSQEFDNLITSDYTLDRTNYKNVALVAGEGEGTARKTAVAGSGSGINRYEMYVDSRNSSTNDGEITVEDYTEMLTQEGDEELSAKENSLTENVEGSVEPMGNYKYDEDYFLGDIVSVINEYGIVTSPRITEIIESEDESGIHTIPTFSTGEEV